MYIRLLRGSHNSLENEQRSEKMNLGLRKNLRGFNFDFIVPGLKTQFLMIKVIPQRSTRPTLQT